MDAPFSHLANGSQLSLAFHRIRESLSEVRTKQQRNGTRSRQSAARRCDTVSWLSADEITSSQEEPLPAGLF